MAWSQGQRTARSTRQTSTGACALPTTRATAPRVSRSAPKVVCAVRAWHPTCASAPTAARPQASRRGLAPTAQSACGARMDATQTPRASRCNPERPGATATVVTTATATRALPSANARASTASAPRPTRARATRQPGAGLVRLGRESCAPNVSRVPIHATPTRPVRATMDAWRASATMDGRATAGGARQCARPSTVASITEHPVPIAPQKMLRGFIFTCSPGTGPSRRKHVKMILRPLA